jgi:hypothetical protein
MILSQKINCGRWTTRFQPTFPILALMLSLTLSFRAAAQSCPIESTAIENAKPNKLYLFFPTTDDAVFPATTCTRGEADCFDTTSAVSKDRGDRQSARKSYKTSHFQRKPNGGIVWHKEANQTR